VPFNDLPIPRAQNILQKMRARQSAEPWAWHPDKGLPPEVLSPLVIFFHKTG